MTEPEKGCAPCAAHRIVELSRDNYETLQPIAKREHTSVQVLVNELLAAQLGKI